jgi:hypothetical protein
VAVVSCRPIVILGAERSGTSVCAEMVLTWGAYMGEPAELPSPDHLNPHGPFEWLPLWDFLAELGEFESGASWWEHGFQERVAAQASIPSLASGADTLIARMESAGRPWAWKDPALCHFLRFWTKFWVRPVFIVMVRDPIDLALSWNRFRMSGGGGETSLRCNLSRWQHMMLSVLQALDTSAAKQFVEYEQLTENPLQQAPRLAGFLDEHCDANTAADVVAKMAAVVDPALRRNRVGHKHRDEMTAAQSALYQFLRAKVGRPDLPFQEAYPNRKGWRGEVIEQEARTAPKRSGR